MSARSDRIGRMKRLVPLLVVAVALGTGGCGRATTATWAQRFTQGGVSMEPTVKAGQVITTRAVGRGYRPRRGDVVLFHGDGEKWGVTKAPFLKRVIAVGGETIGCCDPAGKVTINGVALNEPYVTKDSPLDAPPNPQACLSRRFGPVAVARDAVFLTGDNRAASNDSRCAGPVPVSSVFAIMTGGRG
jgi:signal peptidase I